MGIVVDWTPIINSAIGAVGGGGVVGALAWLREKERAKSHTVTARLSVPSQMVGEAAEFQKFLNEHSERFTASLSQRIETMDGEIQDLKRENLRCRNEANQLRQHVESLETVLRRQGIDIPERRLERSFTVMENGETTTMRADAREDDPPTKPYRPTARRKR